MADTLSLTLSANGVNIEGDSLFVSTASLSRENTIDVLSLEQSLGSAFDRATLRATGRRIYAPIRFTKRLDRATPLLRKALVNNEVLEGHFRWFRPNPEDGTAQHVLTLAFTGGRITKCVLRLPDTLMPETANLPLLEDIEMTAGTYTWTWVPDGIEFEDTVNPSV